MNETITVKRYQLLRQESKLDKARFQRDEARKRVKELESLQSLVLKTYYLEALRTRDETIARLNSEITGMRAIVKDKRDLKSLLETALGKLQ